MATSNRKLEELILYISWRAESDPRFGAVKMNKALFFADFEHFRAHGVSITGATYEKKTHGPVPRGIERAKVALCNAGAAIARQQMAGMHLQRLFIPLRKAQLDLFTAEEISLVDEILDMVGAETATSISELSHRFDGWKLAEMGEEIPYETAVLPDEEVDLSDAEIAYGKQVAARLVAEASKTP